MQPQNKIVLFNENTNQSPINLVENYLQNNPWEREKLNTQQMLDIMKQPHVQNNQHTSNLSRKRERN